MQVVVAVLLDNFTAAADREKERMAQEKHVAAFEGPGRPHHRVTTSIGFPLVSAHASGRMRARADAN